MVARLGKGVDRVFNTGTVPCGNFKTIATDDAAGATDPTTPVDRVFAGDGVFVRQHLVRPS